MDIDSPPSLEESVPSGIAGVGPHHGHNHLVELPHLSATFPLPFRVLTLVGLAIFLWATNLHILHVLGIDPARVLDFRERDRERGRPDSDSGDAVVDLDADEEDIKGTDDLGIISSTGSGPSGDGNAGTGASAHGPVYKLGIGYTAWVGFGWVIFRLLSGGEVERMESWRGLVGVVMLGAALGALLPYRSTGERERRALRRALRRILLPSFDSPVFFCDVILADILTSFAKVLGDLWVSACQIWSGGITQGRVSQHGWSRWITLGMVCLPYALRFRQCIMEYSQSSYTSPRPLANACKYFSAFPVILLSALQKTVVSDLALSKGITVQELKETHSRWFGEHRLFRLWLLAVVVNSMFSFYWDVEMDWGLKLCEVDTWFPKSNLHTHDSTSSRDSGGGIGMGLLARCLRRGSGSMAHQRSPCPTPSPFPGSHPHPHPHPHGRSHSRSMSPSLLSPFSPGSRPRRSWLSFGLRPVLLLPDPIVYHIFTILDLVLRFTWSLKLSSHLHTIAEIESGVFMMEALELIRRWMWVFIRVEWEAVKQAEIRSFAQAKQRERGLGVSEVVWDGSDDKDGV